MQSSTRHSITTSSNVQQSTFVVRTNGQQVMGSRFGKEIQAQSSTSVDVGSKERQELLMRVLMMSFEIQRKDMVVKNLIKELEMMQTRNSVSSNEQLFQVREELARTKRRAEEVEFKLSQLELINSQLSSSRSVAVRQLQQKIVWLQQRNKELQIKRIQLDNECQKLVTENKMLNFRLVNVESTEKGKNRQMQNIVMELEKKIDQEKKISNQLKIIIQSAHEEIRTLKENQIKIVRQFEDKIVLMEKELNHRQDLKRSQAVTSQQRIQMTQQELLRMQEEVKFLRKKLDEQQAGFDKKESQLVAQLRRGKEIQAELFHTKHQNAIMKGQLQQKTVHINNLFKELNEAKSAYNALQESREFSSIEITNTYEQQLGLVRQEAETYRQRLALVQEDLEKYKAEARKLKRQSLNSNLIAECASCKIIQSATTIKSNKQLTQLNLNQIIMQTEKLHDSTLKIQHILSSKKIPIPSMFDSRMSLDNNSFTS